jgi:hypothetical protein
MCQIKGPWPPNSWWPVLHAFVHGEGTALKSDDDHARTAMRWVGELWPQSVDASPPPTATTAAVLLNVGFAFGARPGSMDEAGLLSQAMTRFGPRIDW